MTEPLSVSHETESVDYSDIVRASSTTSEIESAASVSTKVQVENPNENDTNDSVSISRDTSSRACGLLIVSPECHEDSAVMLPMLSDAKKKILNARRSLREKRIPITFRDFVISNKALEDEFK